MKLILSSCDFSHEVSRACISEHLPRPIEECRVLFIPNEKATAEKIQQGKYHLRLQQYGFSRENIFVFDHTRADEFKRLNLDMIYVSGGNTFLTMEKIRASSFDQELIRYIKSGVIYIGGSAGAHIVTKELRHLSVYDPVPADWKDFSGLDLFHGILLCHFCEERRVHYEQLLNEKFFPVIALTDADSMIIETEEK